MTKSESAGHTYYIKLNQNKRCSVSVTLFSRWWLVCSVFCLVLELYWFPQFFHVTFVAVERYAGL
jgi:hypothetical protein